MSEKKLWFKARTYGWGWCPVSREGWVVTAVYVSSIAFFTSRFLMQRASGKFNVALALSTLVLLVICYAKGEKPRWSWGKKS